MSQRSPLLIVAALLAILMIAGLVATYPTAQKRQGAQAGMSVPLIPTFSASQPYVGDWIEIQPIANRGGMSISPDGAIHEWRRGFDKTEPAKVENVLRWHDMGDSVIAVEYTRHRISDQNGSIGLPIDEPAVDRYKWQVSTDGQILTWAELGPNPITFTYKHTSK